MAQQRIDAENEAHIVCRHEAKGWIGKRRKFIKIYGCDKTLNEVYVFELLNWLTPREHTDQHRLNNSNQCRRQF